ncbi:MAG: hypothetical protein FWB78_13085 [Treponema sp.]|nr:hypothetical protein [Treponema sp.]
MKNIKQLRLVVFIVVIVLFFTSCPFVPDDPSVTISGSPIVGGRFTVTSSGRGFSSDHGYEWFLSGFPGGIGGIWIGVGPGYTIMPVDIGSYIFARRFNASRGEFIVSNHIGPILPAD